jgi:hypothetical protein
MNFAELRRASSATSFFPPPPDALLLPPSRAEASKLSPDLQPILAFRRRLVRARISFSCFHR